MPSKSLTAAILILGKKDQLPWSSPTWEAITKTPGPPWLTTENAAPTAVAPNVHGWTNRLADKVKTFAQRTWAIKSADEQDLFVNRKQADNESDGRTAWAKFIKENHTRWGVNRIIDEVLYNNGRSPQQILREMETRILPTIEESQISHCRTALADRLLGASAYQGMGTLLKREVVHFVATLLSLSWNRYRKGLKRDIEKIETNVELAHETWTAMTADGAKPSIEQIKRFLKFLRPLVILLVKYDDPESKTQLQNYQADMEAMLAEMRHDGSDPEKVKRLPKVIRDAISNMATEEEIKEIQRMIWVSLENIQGYDETDRVEVNLDNTLSVENWSEGVEDLNGCREDELWERLGFVDKKLPFFQDFTDPDGFIDPWSDEGQRWLEEELDARRELKPRWHQLIGILRMLERAFEGKPVLLMDGVGLGKTMQVIGAIVCLAYYREYYAKKQTFPGVFAGRRFKSPDGMIPDVPHIIVVPVNLREQWERELKRFLKSSTFDILPYTNRLETRKEWWDIVYAQSLQPHTQRIVLAVNTAIQSDANAIFEMGEKAQMGKSKATSRFQSMSPFTVYGRKFGFFIADEAHSARKHNIAHMAFRALRERASVTIAMTATPVTTKPQDLYIMGQWLGLSGFDDYEEFVRLNREMNRATRSDTKALREAGAEGSVLRGMLIGGTNANAPTLEVPKLIDEWMSVFRGRFASHVIRRTIESVNPDGEKLFGMRPYQEHNLKLEMYEWEAGELRAFAKDLVVENPLAGSDTRKHFYIEFRRSLLHPRLNPKHADGWVRPESLEAWENSPEKTIKLDVLSKLVAYHLLADGSQPMTMDEDGQTLIPKPDTQGDSMTYSDVDRVVIYSAFPSSNNAVIDSLALRGISVVELNGSLTMKKRQSALEAFRKSTRAHGPRVLILSNVGVVGLNLACANIMIMVDTTWSALDDEQLRGRIFRYPQQKQVHFYRLIALRTPDVFLNNISFDKGQLHNAFINAGSSIQELFDGDCDAILSLPGDSDDASEDDAPKSLKSRGRGRGRGRISLSRGRGGKSTRGSKGKGKQREEVRNDDTEDVPMEGTEDEPSASEPAPPKPRPKPRQKMPGEKRPLSSQSPPKSRKKQARKQSMIELETTSDDTNLLVQAAAIMNVNEPGAGSASTLARSSNLKAIESAAPAPAVPSSQATQDFVMQELPADPILDALLAPGGQNSPSTDAALALSNFEATVIQFPDSPTRPARNTDASSPLSSPPATQELEMEAEPTPSTSYALPHRSVSATHRSTSPIGHGGQMSKLKDGSGGRKPKVKKTYARRK